MPGRFEPVDEGQDFGVLVDYAHTPDSLENVLRAARELTRGRVHVVFGAGGDRDRGKRPLMGDAARRLADRVLVTSDNPRSEQPEAIVDEIMEGAGPGAEREIDRARAIALAIEAAEPGDVVVIAGKGHEQGQEFERRAQGALRRSRGGSRGAAPARGRAVIDLSAARVAEAAGGELIAGDPERAGPQRAVIDSRAVEPGDLFVGLPGAAADGGRFAAAALESGAWGAVVGREHATGCARGGRGDGRPLRVQLARRVIAVAAAAGRARGAGPRLAPRAGGQGDRRDGLDRQDVDQGHPGRPARARGCGRTPAARTGTRRSDCR